MFKKFFFIGTLCMSLILLVQTDGNAGKSRTIIGWGGTTTQLCYWWDGEGPGNWTKWPGRASWTVGNAVLQAVCFNASGKNGPPSQLGKPFYSDAVVTGTLDSDMWYTDQNGEFHIDPECIELSQLVGDACSEGGEACPKKGWSCQQDEETHDYLVILKSYDMSLDLDVWYDGQYGLKWYEDVDVYTECNVGQDLHTFTCNLDCDDCDYQSVDWGDYPSPTQWPAPLGW